MTPEDRLNKLEKALAFLSAQIAGVIPVRLADGSGEGGGASGPITLCRVTEEITAASDNLVDNWGSGMVRTMDIATGELSADASEVRNPWNIVFVVDAIVEVAGDIVKNGTCGEYPWAAEA